MIIFEYSFILINIYVEWFWYMLNGVSCDILDFDVLCLYYYWDDFGVIIGKMIV